MTSEIQGPFFIKKKLFLLASVSFTPDWAKYHFQVDELQGNTNPTTIKNFFTILFTSWIEATHY